MAEKGSKGPKPISMKWLNTWDVEKSSPNCIPRLCCVEMCRLQILQLLDGDHTSSHHAPVYIFLKMQNSKRMMRSHEIVLDSSGLLDTELDFSFSFQYPHFIKQDCNKLLVMLKRKKRYKNRAILGYKTVAIGTISLSRVLQFSREPVLQLFSCKESGDSPAALLTLQNIYSKPINNNPHHHKMNSDPSPDLDLSDDEEAGDDEWSNDESDESHHETGVITTRNIKNRFAAILKKFKISEEVFDTVSQQSLNRAASSREIEKLIDELENTSDSGEEMDNISVISTPKPKLRPFFNGGQGFADASRDSKDENCRSSDTHPASDSDGVSDSFEVNGGTGEINLNRDRPLSMRKPKERHTARRRSSTGTLEELYKPAFIDKLCFIMGKEDSLVDVLLLLDTSDWQGQFLSTRLAEVHPNVICTNSSSDVFEVCSVLVNRIQKYCNSNAQSPGTIKVVLLGGDHYVASILRPYAQIFGSKSREWQNYLQFLFIPLGGSVLGRFISSFDSQYSSLFNDAAWKESFEKTEHHVQPIDWVELLKRIRLYINKACCMANLPIGEAVMTFTGKSDNQPDDATRNILPFVIEVRVGNSAQEHMCPFIASLDLDESTSILPSMTSSPSVASYTIEGTPPNSPSMGQPGVPTCGNGSSSVATAYEMTLDYWLAQSQQQSAKDDGEVKKYAKDDMNKKSGKEFKDLKGQKSSLKSTFRSVTVSRLPQSLLSAETCLDQLTLTTVYKEKKQKIMRLGKKSREAESKSSIVDGISRIIGNSKAHTQPLSVNVDGMTFNNVKFFQISSQWQTHVRCLPLVVFSSLYEECASN